MTQKSFFLRLETRVRERQSLLVAGLDPHPEMLSEPSAQEAEAFCLRVAEAVAPYAVAFKVNVAFFEVWGAEGWAALERLMPRLKTLGPVILDVKRGDIASTARAYARGLFEHLDADAVTLFPHLGRDTLEPFLKYTDRGMFLLVRTSNPGAFEVQETPLAGGRPYYLALAQHIRRGTSPQQVGFVVGATQTHALARVRQVAPERWILAPGVGAQGGSLEAAYRVGRRADGLGILFPVSRGLAQAEDPAHSARVLTEATRRLMAEAAGRGEAPPPPYLEEVKVQLARDLVDTGCVRFGTFTLKSGQQAPIYFDLRRLVGFPEVLHRVAMAYGFLLQSLTFDRLAPLPYAALPIGTAVSLTFGWPLVYPRKDVKAYGTAARVEGVFEPGEVAVILDDVLTTGAYKQEALDRLREVGLQVRDVVVLIDREAGGRAFLEAQGLRVHTLFTLEALLDIWGQRGWVPQEDLHRVWRWKQASP